MSVQLLQGDCLEHIKTLPDSSMDSIVTDPPYGLKFMAKKWDYDVPGVEVWTECLRVLKPGGHLLAFGGSRTYHRLAVAVEDAGFEIRDQIMWVYGSGFPKSHNLKGDYDGWGTALKPAHEPIVMARKPFRGAVANNVLEHGTGALNIDGCRVASQQDENFARPVNHTGLHEGWDRPWKHDADALARERIKRDEMERKAQELGRWPANIIHDGSDEVLAAFPDAKGQQGKITGNEPSGKTDAIYGEYRSRNPSKPRIDASKSAARFFYCAKASRKDRHEGLDDPGHQFKHGETLRRIENTATKGNNHPTVKPTDLMAYLCRLVTPANGVVLDPFMGSGSTGKAAVREGFDFIGIELDADYLAIADARIKHEHQKKRGGQRESQNQALPQSQMARSRWSA